ncbi:hypothetical protein P168DRAFT_313393 [Aspergillus campestris IBT 28561]|uniref:Uncharacterized protein n=1 Tax=Aspergillus campestris (strain IBT 28561) TaxID=1392248 RepID=A0A2I1CSM1_ASPC2|nr:uncharacterized protein P168DRAFT_313393 [Aspergillus campestris IBT 28561]PKY00614.1 hypothetical protein P168DRAFT_313393 [Aspergillus campestris IBT 28561]
MSSHEFTKYSNSSSTYWPPGWNFTRYAHATPADNATLSDDERAKMQAGFREVLGEEGVAEMARVVWLEQLRLMRVEKGRRPPPPPPPDWLRVWRKRCQGQKGQGQGKNWGVVVFWTAGAVKRVVDYEDAGGEGVEGFEERVQQIVEIPFETVLDQGQSAEEIDEARRSFAIRWVRVADDDGDESKAGEEIQENVLVERLRARYHSMQEQDSGLFLPIFLVVSSSAVASVLSTPEAGDEKVGTTSPRWRTGAPFLLAVAATEDQGVVSDDDQEAGGEKDWFKPVFRVAMEVVVEELWPVVEEQITTLGRMTRFVQRAEVTETVPTVIDEEDGLDAIWWSVHAPPRHLRKRRRIFT